MMSETGGFRFGPGELYLMPAHFGPRTAEDDGRFDEVTATIVMFETDPERAAELLPPGFELTDPATVIVFHQENRGVHFMAGRGYNLVGINLAARFVGEQDDCTGSYALVMWESEFIPVVLGREFLGVPKLVADVPDIQTWNERRLFSVSEYGSKLLHGEVSGLAQLDDQGVASVKQRLDDSQWMGWRYLPAAAGPDSEVSYPTAIEVSRELDAAWLGAGHVEFHPATREQAPASHLVMSALASLPILNDPMAIITHGSIEQGHARRLR